MTRIIRSSQLTTCDTVDGGAAIRLDFKDESGQPVSVTLPFEQAQSVVMTLPNLLSDALRKQTQNDKARFVFNLGHWTLEGASKARAILTLRTEDGFEVSFAVPIEACPSIGRALNQEGATVSTSAHETRRPAGLH